MDEQAGSRYRFAMANTNPSVGEHLRHWRQHRRLSQLDLACEARISTRHLSFIETGRSHPSREMLLRLADQLDVPLRQRNTLLLAGGYAPYFAEHALTDAAMRETQAAIAGILKAHEPFPALAIDGHWTLVLANQAVAPLLAGVASWLLEPPVNVLRLSLHPEGLAPRILNLGEWRAHLLHRLRRQYDETADAFLLDLSEELAAYPAPGPCVAGSRINHAIAVPMRLQADAGILSLLSATMVFGTPRDITLSELALETFLPADAATAAILNAFMSGKA